MGVFVLGTSPLFFGLGYLTTVLGDAFRTKFLKIAAVAVLYLGITSLNAALIVAGSPVTLQTIADNSPIQIDLSGEASVTTSRLGIINGTQEINIQASSRGYTPNYVQLKAGAPARLNLISTGRLGCASQFRIPTLGVVKNLVPDATTTIEITPQQKGKLIGTCAMGMFQVVMDVI